MVKNSLSHFIHLVLQETSLKDPGYLLQLKYYGPWKKSLEPGRNAIEDEMPWITFPAIDFLKTHLNKDSRVFEYGAGGSSLFFINHCKEVVTIEHHKEWFQKILEKVNIKKSTNWVGKLIPPEKRDTTSQLEPANPQHYYTDEEAYFDCTFKSYVTYVDNYPDSYFDLVMIDGRSRASCIWHGMPKVKPGGYLLIDNSNRRSYFKEVGIKLETDFKLIFDQKAPSPYLNYLTQTAVWRRNDIDM